MIPVDKVKKIIERYISLEQELSTGKVDRIGFNEIEILPGKNGEPIVSLIEKLSYIKLIVSISHEKEYAIAMALIIL